jgi:hypothetical protein
VTAALDDYLLQFRAADGQAAPPRRRRSSSAKGRTKAYYLLRESLPPAAFDLAVGHGFYRVRSALGGMPGRNHVLPDFLIPGVAKCGTTSLFDWMCEHPLIRRPTSNGKPRKEILFFDYNFFRGLDWYRLPFPLESERDEFIREHGRPPLTGEASASYLTNYWVPQRVAKVLPNVKLIVTLRDPVDRAYSAYQMSRREGLEACDTFEAALALESERLAPELERARRNPHYNPPLPPPLGYWSYLHRSRYDDHVSRWLEYFPRDQFLFIKFEDLAAEPQRTVDTVYGFLGLPPHRHDGFTALNTARYDEMRPETRAQLASYFRPHNERLRELTGIDFGWDRR